MLFLVFGVFIFSLLILVIAQFWFSFVCFMMFLGGVLKCVEMYLIPLLIPQ